eukprot:15328664-Ditylum_brightwellii.AAC.1
MCAGAIFPYGFSSTADIAGHAAGRMLDVGYDGEGKLSKRDKKHTKYVAATPIVSKLYDLDHHAPFAVG